MSPSFFSLYYGLDPTQDHHHRYSLVPSLKPFKMQCLILRGPLHAESSDLKKMAKDYMLHQ